MNNLEAKAAKRSFGIYVSISLGIALLFLLVSYIDGRAYTAVARIGGMVWVFILSMIVSMPIVIPAVKKKILGN